MNSAVSLAIVAALFAMMFKWLPDAQVAWRDVWAGAVVTAILFEVGKLLIGLYIGQQSLESTFGAATSLVVLLIWVYYSSQIVLLGAEFTRIYAAEHGSLNVHAVSADSPEVGKNERSVLGIRALASRNPYGLVWRPRRPVGRSPMSDRTRRRALTIAINADADCSGAAHGRAEYCQPFDRKSHTRDWSKRPGERGEYAARGRGKSVIRLRHNEPSERYN